MLLAVVLEPDVDVRPVAEVRLFVVLLPNLQSRVMPLVFRLLDLLLLQRRIFGIVLIDCTRLGSVHQLS